MKTSLQQQNDYHFTHKHILGLSDLNSVDIDFLLRSALSFKEISSRKIKKVPALRGRTIINLFFEPSTRTRLSFEVAAKRMSADTFNIAPATSSRTKGETLIDTALNLAAMNPDIIIIRHSHSGSAALLAKHTKASIINAGDGFHEHPSQGLLDMMTVIEHKGKLAGLKIAIIGDITHSRVAHSNIIGFTKMGASVSVSGPATLIPVGIESLGAQVCSTVEEAVADADVVMALRIQFERQTTPFFPSVREYANHFGLNDKVLSHAKPDAIVMHPGPINRGVEIDPRLADGPRSVILDQVTNGVALRMAMLYAIMGGSEG
ncbi:MAG: aspartate carbamoyltransferase catalytic subunit [Desulfobulbaceae bacterium]|jgi:aspartate carbamoyltransferase catalytic subunit|nr:aspartate carbamoyltransferase catalytic subunit [Desulfobulbaceae bacterium]